MANINRSFIFTEETKVRGMLVPQRSEHSLADQNTTKSPFISMVTVKDPLGFNPVHKPVIIERKKNDNEIYNQNRKYLQIIKEKGKKKKSEKVVTDPISQFSKMNKAQSMKYLKPIEILKQNEQGSVHNCKNQEPTIDKLNFQKEAQIDIQQNKLEDNIKNVIQTKQVTIISDIKEKTVENHEEVQEKVVKDNNNNSIHEDFVLTEDNEEREEMNEILGYIHNLDYEKYSQDLEIREALQLIKNKMDKELQDKEEKTNHERIKQEEIQNKNYSIEKKNAELVTEVILPDIKNPIINKQEEEKKEEIKKLQIAEQISKCDPKIRAIHSYQSIKKLLEREGLNNPNLIDPLRITLIKEKPLSKDDDYISNKLPFLHSLPLI